MLWLLLALFAQQRPPDMPLTSERRAQIVENTAKKIEELYVYPDKGKEIAAAIRGTSFTQPSALELVPAVNAVLKTSGDGHLRFGYDPAPAADDKRLRTRSSSARRRAAAHTWLHGKRSIRISPCQYRLRAIWSTIGKASASSPMSRFRNGTR